MSHIIASTQRTSYSNARAVPPSIAEKATFRGGDRTRLLFLANFSPILFSISCHGRTLYCLQRCPIDSAHGESSEVLVLDDATLCILGTPWNRPAAYLQQCPKTISNLSHSVTTRIALASVYLPFRITSCRRSYKKESKRSSEAAASGAAPSHPWLNHIRAFGS